MPDRPPSDWAELSEFAKAPDPGQKRRREDGPVRFYVPVFPASGDLGVLDGSSMDPIPVAGGGRLLVAAFPVSFMGWDIPTNASEVHGPLRAEYPPDCAIPDPLVILSVVVACCGPGLWLIMPPSGTAYSRFSTRPFLQTEQDFLPVK